jgi:hypothetical protein
VEKAFAVARRISQPDGLTTGTSDSQNDSEANMLPRTSGSIGTLGFIKLTPSVADGTSAFFIRYMMAKQRAVGYG